MKKEQIEIIAYPKWAGKKLDNLCCEYEFNGKTYYRPSFGFVAKGIGGREEELMQSIEQTFIQKLNGLSAGVDLSSVKGCHEIENGIYTNIVSYFISSEDTNLEKAETIAKQSCNAMREVYESILKGETEPIDLERHGWIFDMMHKDSNNLVSVYLGQPKAGEDYLSSENTYLKNNSRFNEALTSTIYTTMQYKEYLLINTVYSVSKEEAINIKLKIDNKIDLYQTSAGLTMSDGLHVSLPIIFGIGNGNSFGTADSQGTSATQGATQTENVGQSTQRASSDSNGHADSINVSKGENDAYNEGYNKSTSDGSNVSGTISGGMLVKGSYNQGVTKGESNGSSSSSTSGHSSTEGTGQADNTSHTTSNSVGETKSIGNATTQSNGVQNGHSNSESTSNNISVGTGLNVGESKTQMVRIEDKFQADVIEQLEMIDARLQRGLKTHVFLSQIVGICKDEQTRCLLDETLVGSVAGGETQPFVAINLNDNDAKSTLEMVTCFKAMKNENDDILEQGKYLTLVNAEEVPFMYPPNVSLTGFNASKDVPPNGYYRNQNTIEKNNYHHLGRCIDPNTLRKTNIPVDILSRLSTAILGTTNAGKSTIDCHYMLNYLDKYKGSRIILFNNKFSDDFYVSLKNMKKDNIKVKIYSLGDSSGKTGTPFYNNLFHIPEGSELTTWIEHLAGVLCKILGQRDRTLSLLMPALEKLYNEVGIFSTDGQSISSMLVDEDFIIKVHTIISGIESKLQSEERMSVRKRVNLETRVQILNNLITRHTAPTVDTHIINRQNAKYLKYQDILDTIKSIVEEKTIGGERLDFNTLGTLNSMSDKFSSLSGKYSLRVLASEQLEEDPFEKVLKNDADITIFNTSGMGSQEKQLIGEIMIRYMYCWIFQNKDKYNLGCKETQTSINLMMEEAGIYFANTTTSDSGNSVIDSDIWTNISMEGRSSGFFYTVITQNPKELPDYLLSQCKNFLVLKLTDDDNKKSVLKAMGYNPERLDMRLLYWLTQQPVGMFTYKCTDVNLNDSKPLLVSFNEVF